MTKQNVRLPRLGFLGTGWIGLNRLQAVAASGDAEIAAVADTSPENARKAAEAAPGATIASSLDGLLDLDLDAIVIATPSACHADQAIAALQRGLAVFCQKPLARTMGETAAVVSAARHADRLISVDFSYRFTEGIRKIRELVQAGELGEVYSADLVFHNAYGPDKSWFFDAALSGGGCLMDLGIHLIDLALWTLDFPKVTDVTSAVYGKGRKLSPGNSEVEDFAVATCHLETGAAVRIACSWNLPAGREAVIDATFYGTSGGARFRNVNGSFYDFAAERFRGTARETLASPPDEWGGRAVVAWVRQLRQSPRYDPAADKLVEVAAALDRAYGRHAASTPHGAAYHISPISQFFMQMQSV